MSSSRKTAAQEFEKTLPAVDKARAELAPYMDGQPYDEGRLISEVELYTRMHVSSGFEIGRRLVVLKAQTEHGRFQEIVESRLQLSTSYARSLMSLARICIELNSVSKGMIDFDKLKAMDSRKVHLLGSVIPEYASELTESGTIKGRTLDEWDAKSRDEIRKEIKTRDQQIEKLKANAQSGIEKRTELQDRIDALTSHTPDATSEAITRVSRLLKNAIADFENTGITEADLPDATHHALVEFKAGIRSFAWVMCDMIDTAYPSVAAIEDNATFEGDAPAEKKTATVRSILKPEARPQYKTNGKKGN